MSKIAETLLTETAKAISEQLGRSFADMKHEGPAMLGAWMHLCNKRLELLGYAIIELDGLVEEIQKSQKEKHG